MPLKACTYWKKSPYSYCRYLLCRETRKPPPKRFRLTIKQLKRSFVHAFSLRKKNTVFGEVYQPLFYQATTLRRKKQWLLRRYPSACHVSFAFSLSALPVTGRTVQNRGRFLRQRRKESVTSRHHRNPQGRGVRRSERGPAAKRNRNRQCCRSLHL